MGKRKNRRKSCPVKCPPPRGTDAAIQAYPEGDVEMGKKLLIPGILVVIGLIIVWFVLPPRADKTIPLLHNCYFGMTPKAAVRQFGAPSDVQYDVGGTGKTTYDYTIPVLESESNITFYFLDNETLTEVSVTWPAASDELYEQIYSVLYEAYANRDHFFLRQPHPASGGIVTASLGTDDAVTGLHYSIYRTDSELSVLCVDNSLEWIRYLFI